MLTIVVAIIIAWIIIAALPTVFAGLAYLLFVILDWFDKPPDQPKTQPPPGGV